MDPQNKPRRNRQPYQTRLNVDPAEVVTLNLRLEPSLHAALKQVAHEACRSVQGEILFRLRKTMAEA
jgi:hypothetical protein